MSIYLETAMCELLDASSDVVELRDNRIYPDLTEQNPETPYQVYFRIDNQHEHHLRGSSGLCHVRVQLNSYAKSKLEARRLTEASRIALDGFTGTVTVPVDGGIPVKIQSCRLDRDNDEFVPPSDGSGAGVYVSSADFVFSVEEPVPVH